MEIIIEIIHKFLSNEPQNHYLHYLRYVSYLIVGQ